MIIDTHAHLTYKGLREDTEAIVERARAAGVDKIITVGIGVEDSERAVATAHRFVNVWATVGIHPHDAAAFDDAALARLYELAKDPKVVGWGETGLDYFRDWCPVDAQKKAFRAQAAAARRLDLPLVVHDREAHEDVLSVLRKEAALGLRGVVHCFSGDVAFAREVIELGFYISIPGTVTYPKNTMLKEVVAAVPLERCFLETDAPFLSPQKLRSKKNEPAFMVHTAEEVARIKGLSVEDVGRITTRAAVELFGIGESQTALLAYPIRDSLYLNVTDKCTNRCVFCAKYSTSVVKGHDLQLTGEPTVEELLEAVELQGGPGAWAEVVFCGFGEPLLRLDVVLEAAKRLKAQGAKKIRVNTDGLASLIHGRDVVSELAGVVDSVSVSLNAPDAESYRKLCRPEVEGAYEALKTFVKRAVQTLPEVAVTAVTVPGLDVDACERVARELGAEFRRREYNEVG